MNCKIVVTKTDFRLNKMIDMTLPLILSSQWVQSVTWIFYRSKRFYSRLMHLENFYFINIFNLYKSMFKLKINSHVHILDFFIKGPDCFDNFTFSFLFMFQTDVLSCSWIFKKWCPESQNTCGQHVDVESNIFNSK